MFGLARKSTYEEELQRATDRRKQDDREILELRDRIQGLLFQQDDLVKSLAQCRDEANELGRNLTDYRDQVNNFWWAISQRKVAIFTDADSYMGRTTHRYTVFFKPHLTRPGDVMTLYGWDATKREESPEEWAVIGRLATQIGIQGWWWDDAERRLHKTYYEISALLKAPADIKAAEEELQGHLNRASRADAYRNIMESKPEPEGEGKAKE